MAVLLFAMNAAAQAQDNPPPAPAGTPPAAPAEAPAQTDMQKWIAATDAQWQAAFKRDVMDAHEAEARKLMLQYVAALEEGIAKASKASDLDGALALRNEQKRFRDTQIFPEQDEAADAASVKQIRAAIRALLAKLDTDQAIRTKALHAKYDQVLAQAQTQLTQRQRFDDALLLKAKREKVAAAWITPGVAALAEVPAAAVPPPPAPKPEPRTPAPVAASDSDKASTSVKALVAGSRWKWFETPNFTGKAYWVEFYHGGSARTSCGKGHTWEVLPANVVHLFQPSDKRNWYFDIDVGKRVGTKNAEKDRNNNSIRYEKRVTKPPR
jgi:hypothetical protein